MNHIKIALLLIIVLFPNLSLEGMKYKAMPNINIEYTREDFQEDLIKILNTALPLEEDEIVLDYRYIGEDLEVFSQIGDKFYRKFYKINQDKIELVSEEEVEFGKGGLKIQE